MLRHYEHRSETVQHFSESEYESGSESEEDQKLVKFGQHAFVQRSDAGQCGSAVGAGASMASGQQENYFATLSDQYNRALALNGDAYLKEWENNGCTYTDHQVDYHANKYIGYAQDSASHTAFSQKKSMVPTSSRPSTPQIGKKEQGYAYYENNQVNNGSSKPSIPKNGNGEQGYAYYEIHHLDNAGSKPQLSTTKIGKEEKGYASYETNKASNGRAYYNESSQFNNGGSKPSTFNRGNEERRYAHYESNHANDGSSKLKPSTPKKEKEDQYGYAYYESNKDNSERMGHLRNNKDLNIPQGSRPKPSKGVIKSVYYYEEREFDNHPHGRNGAYYKRESYIPPNSKQI